MQYDYIYNSEKQTWEAEVEMNRETKPQANILFEIEGIVLCVDCRGNAIFYDGEGNEIYKDKAEAKVFLERIHICVKEDKISVRFPITEWIDHYPNCDGEYDRWSERIVDNIYMYCPIK